MIKLVYRAVFLWGTAGAMNLFAADVQRFPQPDFETGYRLPDVEHPSIWSAGFEITNLVVLALALGLATWIALKRRRRREMWLLSIFCLLWFGFYRQGCVCPVGSVQNVAQAGCMPHAYLAWPVVALFALPLFFTLFTGRIFCAAVCPLGAIQDLVLVRPIKLSKTSATLMHLCAVIILIGTVIFAATGTRFLACKLDPFVTIFRLDGTLTAILVGVVVLTLCTVIARPFCRAICPYGVVLGWLSHISVRHMTITPDECINGRLCEQSCPVGAIRPPAPRPTVAEREQQARRAIKLLLFGPLLIALLTVAGAQLPRVAGSLHPDIALSREIKATAAVPGHSPSLQLEAFQNQGLSREQLFQRAARTEQRLKRAGGIGGLSLGILIALTFFFNLRVLQRKGYSIDQQYCVSCMRCAERCPREKTKRMNRTINVKPQEL